MIRINRQHKQRAQSVLEYAMVIACIATALVTMQIYIKRSLQGRIRDAADEIGEQYSAKTTKSELTQTITTPKDKYGKEQYITTTGKPRFIDVVRSDGTTEKREIMEIERKEPMTIGIKEGSYEETGKLSDEELFYKPK